MHVVAGTPLDAGELSRLDRHWRAANYLSVGQIYLMDNPLLRERLTPEHVKPRLLGHWGTTPGLNLLYTHLNRIIARRGREIIYMAGPGPRRSGAGRQRVAGGNVQRGLSLSQQRPSSAWHGCSDSSPFPVACRATSRPRRRDRSTRAANSATRWRMPSARRWTTRTSSSPVSSATARPRRAHSRRRGTPTSSSTLPATAPCCRSCTSTATRSRTRPCWPGSATMSSPRC